MGSKPKPKALKANFSAMKGPGTMGSEMLVGCHAISAVRRKGSLVEGFSTVWFPLSYGQMSRLRIENKLGCEITKDFSRRAPSPLNYSLGRY